MVTEVAQPRRSVLLAIVITFVVVTSLYIGVSLGSFAAQVFVPWFFLLVLTISINWFGYEICRRYFLSALECIWVFGFEMGVTDD
jgi:putative Mn2+ efflux pump MntP